jgi:hypothetical protein
MRRPAEDGRIPKLSVMPTWGNAQSMINGSMAGRHSIVAVQCQG